MKLTLDEAINILEKQPPDEHLAKAVYHENRVKLHAEPTLETPDNPAYNFFLRKVKNRIPDDAYDRFTSLIDFPFATVDFTEGVFSSFNKVFESSDRYVNITFTNPDFEADFKPFKTKVDKWFQEYGVTALKTKFNSYIVVDLPAKQEGPRPEPYFYCLPSGNVLKVKINRKNQCEWIAFDTGDKLGREKKKVIAFFDDMHYRLLVEDKGKFIPLLREDGNPAEIAHNLGWCPVAPFWSDIMDPTVTMLNKKCPATNSLGRLDTLAFKIISKEYSDLYNLYPILWSYPEEEDEDRLTQQEGFPEGDECYDPPIQKNESNSKKIMTNPGRHVIKPLPDTEMGDIGDPGGFIQPNVENLEFIQSDLDSRKLSVQYSIAGKPGEPKNDQAKNQKQIDAGFEGEYTILLHVAQNFAVIEKWMLKTIAALRYDTGSIKEVSVNNGKNFFLHTHYEIMEEIKVAKDINMSPYLIDQQERAFIETKYKSNPDKQERMEMMRLLTPYRQMTIDQVMEKAQFLDPDKVRLRIEFTDVLDEFETKFAAIESFMKGSKEEVLEIDERIKMIKDEFKLIIKRNNYVNNFGSPENAIPGANGQRPASQEN